MNDIERAREKRVNAKKKWQGVTNELVISHANPDCKKCGGHGYTGPETDGQVCEASDCAAGLFAIAYKGRLRFNQQRRRLEVFA